jgi:hypothetical protein
VQLGIKDYVGLMWSLVFASLTPIFEWSIARLVVKNGLRKDMYNNEIRKSTAQIIPCIFKT